VAIPLVYNVKSLRARWTSTVVAVVGIAGTVSVFVAMLSLARGFEATLVASGSPRNAIVRRAGATSEMDSGINVDHIRIIEDAPGVAWSPRFHSRDVVPTATRRCAASRRRCSTCDPA
jgi:putative ABC transport system permease protein